MFLVAPRRDEHEAFIFEEKQVGICCPFLGNLCNQSDECIAWLLIEPFALSLQLCTYLFHLLHRLRSSQFSGTVKQYLEVIVGRISMALLCKGQLLREDIATASDLRFLHAPRQRNGSLGWRHRPRPP